MPQAVPERVPPETKDWTWVLHERCPQCSLDAGVLTLSEIPMLFRSQVQVWPVVLLRRNVAERPAPQVWSPLEYGAHTRDVLRLFQERLARMLAEDEPSLADWDPNEAALQGGYHDADPDTVAAEILTEAEKLATAVEAVPADAAERRGLRSDGAAFTVTTLMQYLVHDLVHHLWDVTEGDTEDSAAPGGAESVPPAGTQATGTKPGGAQGVKTGSGTGQSEEASEGVSSEGSQNGSADAPTDRSADLPTDRSADVPTDASAGGATDMPTEDAAGGTTGVSGVATSTIRAEDSQAGAVSDPMNDSQPHETGVPAGPADDVPETPPIQAFANRHRRVLGVATTVIAVALAVLDVTVLPQPDVSGGVRAFVLRWAAPVCWVMIAGVALTWALSVRRAVVNAFAYVAVACWLVYLGARVI